MVPRWYRGGIAVVSQLQTLRAKCGDMERQLAASAARVAALTAQLEAAHSNSTQAPSLPPPGATKPKACVCGGVLQALLDRADAARCKALAEVVQVRGLPAARLRCCWFGRLHVGHSAM